MRSSVVGTFVAGVCLVVAAPTATSVADGQEIPTCNGLPATIIGTEGRDNIRGTTGDDVIVGLGGSDRIVGLGGHDVICGGEGRDRIRGGSGRDLIFGDGGRDRLIGGGGDDIVRGMGGNDIVDGAGGNDVIRGNRGRDRLTGGDGVDDCVDHTAELVSCEVSFEGRWLGAEMTSPESNFGLNVAIDGDTIVVASDNAATETERIFGALWILTANGSGGYDRERLVLPNGDVNSFGDSVAIEGDLIAVGVPTYQGRGAVALIRRVDGIWEYDRALQSDRSTGSFGKSVAIDDGRIAVGAPGTRGRASVFTPSGPRTWTETIIEPPAGVREWSFGNSIDISGDAVVVGDPVAESFIGRAFVYEASGIGYQHLATLESPSVGAHFARSVAIDGNMILIGEPGLRTSDFLFGGGVHRYDLRTVTSRSVPDTFIATLSAGQASQTGTSIDISDDYVIVGSPGKRPGQVRVFPRDGDVIGEPQIFESRHLPYGGSFGVSVGVHDGFIVVGAPGADVGDAQGAGEIHVRRVR